MAEQRYVLNTRDRRLMQEAIRITQAGKTSQRPVPTRRRNRGGGGSGSRFANLAILYDVLEPMTLSVDLTADDSSAVTITPGLHLTETTRCIMPLVFDRETSQYKAKVWGPDSEGTAGEPMKVPGENHCWETCIVGGDGLEIGSTSVYNEAPLLVDGTTYKRVVDDESMTFFAVTDVITPAVMFIAEADAAVTGGDFDAVATVGIHGKSPLGFKYIKNELGWDIDSGGSVIVVRGVDDIGVKYWAFNAECPT